MRRHGLDECLTQIKIAEDAFLVETIEAEHRLGVFGVDRVFDLADPGDTFRAKVDQLHRQGLQFPKLFRETDGLLGALAFLPTVIGARTGFFGDA